VRGEDTSLSRDSWPFR